MQDMLLCQRVSKSWKTIVERSTRIQEALFYKCRAEMSNLKVTSKSYMANMSFNELVMDALHIEVFCVRWEPPPESPSRVLNWFEPDTTSYVGLGPVLPKILPESCRRMLIVQSPVKCEFDISVYRCRRCNGPRQLKCDGSWTAQDIWLHRDEFFCDCEEVLDYSGSSEESEDGEDFGEKFGDENRDEKTRENDENDS